MMINEELYNLTVKYKEVSDSIDWVWDQRRIHDKSPPRRDRYTDEQTYLMYKESFERRSSALITLCKHLYKEQSAIEEAILKHSEENEYGL